MWLLEAGLLVLIKTYTVTFQQGTLSPEHVFQASRNMRCSDNVLLLKLVTHHNAQMQLNTALFVLFTVQIQMC